VSDVRGSRQTEAFRNRPLRVAVVGHVETVEFARVARVPQPGEIVTATDAWIEAGGGGGVSAIQLAALAGDATLFVALGDDAAGRGAREELEGRGVRVEAAWRPPPQRRAFTYVDEAGERTITLLSRKLHPHGDDRLPWDLLAEIDAVYFTAGDAAALRAARRARVLVATARELPTLVDARVALDALVRSAADASERYRPGDLDPPPRLVVATEGRAGGRYAVLDGPSGRYAAVPRPGPRIDSYGAGDCFAAGLTFALGSGLAVEPALAFAARCAAGALTGPGVHVTVPQLEV
jgi:ribokinase